MFSLVNTVRRIFDSIAGRFKSSRFGRNAFWSLIGAMIMRGLGLLTTILLVRILEVKVFGQFVALQGSLGLFGTFAGLGMGMTITKHLAELKERNPDRASRVMTLCYAFSITSALLMCLVLWFFAESFCEHVFNSTNLLAPFRIALLILFANTVNGLLDSTYQGLEWYQQLATLTGSYGIFYLILAAIGAYFLGLIGAVSALAISRLLIAIAKVICLLCTGISFTFSRMFSELHVLRDYSLPSLASTLVSGPVDWLPAMVFASVPGGYEALGVFGVFNQLKSFILFLPDAVGRTNIPVLADAYGGQDKNRFFVILRRGVLINLLLASLVAIPFLAATKLISSVYGVEYDLDFLLVLIIGLTAVVNASANAQGYAYICSGMVWKDFRFRLSAFVVFLISLYLVRKYSTHLPVGLALLGCAYWLSYLLGLLVRKNFFEERHQVG